MSENLGPSVPFQFVSESAVNFIGSLRETSCSDTERQRPGTPAREIRAGWGLAVRGPRQGLRGRLPGAAPPGAAAGGSAPGAAGIVPPIKTPQEVRAAGTQRGAHLAAQRRRLRCSSVCGRHASGSGKAPRVGAVKKENIGDSGRYKLIISKHPVC